MPAKPMIDDLELQQVQKIEAEEKEAVSAHPIPALDGDFLQNLGRRAVRVTLNGVLTGPEVGDGLKKLREKFQATDPVPFVADIATAIGVDKMLIEAMDVRELAGKPERFEYAVALREFIPPPEPKEEPPPPPPPKPDVKKATLIVEVIVDGQPNFDFNTVTVTVGGKKADGSQLSTRTLKNRKDNVWTEDDFPPGQYTAQAVVSVPQAMSGSANANVQAGQKATATIHLTPGGGVVVAQTFVVHFEIDKAFIEPCMRQVLRDAAQFAKNNPTTKLLVSGNTDLVGTPGAPTGSDPYNQSLSERRARSVFAFITFGRDPEPAVTEWQELRKGQAKPHPTINDKWGTRQVQFMLQDLGFYPGRIDGQDGPLTQEAIRAFRCHEGLPPGTTMDDPTWDALIRAYLKQDSLAVPASQFFSNCGTEILKWTGCASQDPQKNVRTAWRPNRRVELLFVKTDKLPCDIAQPDTFDLPTAGAVGSGWCVGPGDVHHRACFVVPLLPPGGQPTDKEWLRQPAQPGTITVQGSIKFDDGKPYAKKKFVLITPIGECKADEQPDGKPVAGKTGDSGEFQFAGQPAGVYTLEVQNDTDVVVRLEDDDSAAKGAIVCKELLADTDRLNVVILSDPVQREIKLPVVAHLMTALHPLTHVVRTCPAAIGPAQGQATAHSEDEIRAAFATANQIWRQARIHFELTDIVHETYSFRTDCEVDGTEFQILLERAADDIPDVVNVFFFGDLAGTGEAGMGISVEDGAGDGIAGCAVGDRFQFTALGPPIDVPLDEKQTAQVLAHELGHYLHLPHAADSGANADRLMLPGTTSGDNRKLDRTEVGLARASRGANDDCVPLSLTVTGATKIGGTLSNRFIVIQGSTGPVKVDAQIPDRMLDPAAGLLDMTGGDPGTNNKQRTVGTATNGTVQVVATYTPTGGGTPATRRDIILVSSFRLRVDGATQVGGANSTTFVTAGGPGQPIVVNADLDPAPFAVPSDLVVWKGGDAADDPQRRTVSRTAAGETVVSATVAGVTRSVTIRVFLVEAVANPTAAAPALTFVRFGLWDNAYDAAGNVKNAADDANNFVSSDKRKFHFRVTDPTVAGQQISLNWKTLNAGQASDDAPANQSLTLAELTPGSKVFVSRAVMLVTDDTDVNFPTHSGFTAPAPDAGLRNAGQSNHRTRRAKMDGFLRTEYSPAGGGTVGITLPLFNRLVQFATTDSTDNVPAGVATLTPRAMLGNVNGVRFSIKVGSSLTIDTGDNQEVIVVTAVTATTFTAVLTKAHNGTVSPFPITGTADERRRVQARVIRYTNPAFPALIAATDAEIAGQFQHLNRRWNQVGIQVDPQPTVNRTIPAAAIDATGVYGGSANNPQEQAALADLIPVTPDDTLTVVFVSLSSANAYSATFPRTPIPLPAGGTVLLADRHFIFINPGLILDGDTLAHEMHHVLFNRGDNGVLRQFFTFNTKPSASFGLPLPDVRVRRRVHNFHTPDPDNDPGNNNVINWAKRVRTNRFPIAGDLNPAADNTTGNRLAGDF